MVTLDALMVQVPSAHSAVFAPFIGALSIPAPTGCKPYYKNRCNRSMCGEMNIPVLLGNRGC